MIRALALAVLCWTVTAQPGRVIDGDTFEANVLVYPKIVITERVRVLGVNTPEMKTATMGPALQAKSYTEAWLARGPVELMVGCFGAQPYDSFGRLLAIVTREGNELAADLIKSRNGVAR